MATADPTTLVGRLADFPARLGRAGAEWAEARLRAAPAGTWSAVSILAHLRAAEAISAPRVGAILVRDQSPLPAFDERRWAAVAGYADHPFHDALRHLAAVRAETARLLGRAAPADWGQVGLHETAGPLTLLALVAGWVAHEEEHGAQLAALGRWIDGR